MRLLTLARLLLRTSDQRRLVAIYACVAVVSAVLSALAPMLLTRIIDSLSSSDFTRPVLMLGTAAVAASIGQIVAATYAQTIAVRIGSDLTNEIRIAIYSRLVKGPLQDLEHGGGGYAVARILNDPGQLERFFETVAQGLFGNIVMVLAALGGLWYLYPPSLGLLLVFTPLLMCVVLRRGQHNTRSLEAQLNAYRSSAAYLGEYVAWTSVLMTRAHGLEALGRTRLAAILKSLAAATTELTRTLTTSMGIASGATGVFSVLVYCGGVFIVASGALTLGALVGVVALLSRAVLPVSAVASAMIQLGTIDVVASRAELELLEFVPPPQDPLRPPDGSQGRPTTGPLITITDLHSSYDGPSGASQSDTGVNISYPNCSFTPSSLTCIVGPNGSGKSSLLRLILGVLTPDSGSIIFDGRLSPQEWQQGGGRFGLLLQDPFVFSGTIRHNLTFGESIIDDQLWEAMETVGLAGRSRFGNAGLDTAVGPGGISLSGGERQRLGLARLVATQPQVVLMDEPTSQVDAVDGEFLGRVLRSLPASTKLLVTHDTRLTKLADGVLSLR